MFETNFIRPIIQQLVHTGNHHACDNTNPRNYLPRSIVSHNHIHIEVPQSISLKVEFEYFCHSGMCLGFNIFHALEILNTCHIWSGLHLVLFEYRNLKHVFHITRKSLPDRKYKHLCVTSLILKLLSCMLVNIKGKESGVTSLTNCVTHLSLFIARVFTGYIPLGNNRHKLSLPSCL